MCCRQFYSIRISTLCCSKKCNNKCRSVPDHILQELIKRNNQYMIKADQLVAQVPDINGTIRSTGYVPKKATTEHPLGEDEGYLLALAKEKKRKMDEANIANMENAPEIRNPNDDIEDCPDLSDILDKEK